MHPPPHILPTIAPHCYGQQVLHASSSSYTTNNSTTLLLLTSTIIVLLVLLACILLLIYYYRTHIQTAKHARDVIGRESIEGAEAWKYKPPKS